MKKRFFSLFVCAALLLSVVFSAYPAWADSSSDGDGTYTDPETGASFTVPEGWKEDTFNVEDAASFYQVNFVSKKDPGSSFLYGSQDLWTTTPAAGHVRSEIDSSYIYQERTLLESLPDIASELGITVEVDGIRLVMYGGKEFIEIPLIQEFAGISISGTNIWYIENGYAYCFMFSGTSDAAAADFQSILSSLQVPYAGSSSFTESFSYTDPNTGATFVVPGEWTKQEADTETLGVFQIQFTSQKQAGNVFRYGSADLWEAATASERSGHTRTDFNSAYFYTYLDGAYVEYMAESLVQGASEGGGNAEMENIQLVTYGSNECIEFTASLEMYGIRSPIIMILYIENGYMYTFTFFGTSSNAAINFQPIIKSLQTPAAEASSSDGNGSGQSDDLIDKIMLLIAKFLFFLGELAFTFFFLALPFFLYRNRIRKRPMGKIITLIIVIPYVILVYWLVMEVTRHYITPWVPLIWCCFTYRDMTRKKDSDVLPKNAADGSAPQQSVKAIASQAPQLAAAVPMSSAPQALPSPAASTPAPATVQAPPAAQHGTSAPSADSAPMWPAQYDSTQDMRVDSPKQKRKASASTPVPDAPFIPAAAAPQAPPSPAAHTPASTTPAPAAYPSASPTPQTPPAPRVQFCRNCGFRLLEDSKFCSCCGTLVMPDAKE